RRYRCEAAGLGLPGVSATLRRARSRPWRRLKVHRVLRVRELRVARLYQPCRVPLSRRRGDLVEQAAEAAASSAAAERIVATELELASMDFARTAARRHAVLRRQA